MNTKSISFLVFISCVSTSLAKTPYITCSSGGRVSNVVVKGCNSSPCVLKKGTDASLSVEFTPDADVTEVTDDVKGIINGTPVPFPTEQPDACSAHGLTCPLKKGQKYTYTAVTPVNVIYPTLPLIVHWMIKDKSGKPLFCVKIPAEIK